MGGERTRRYQPLFPLAPSLGRYQLRTTPPPLSSIAQRALRGGGTSKANGTYEDRLRSEPCLFTSMRNRASEIRRFFRKLAGQQ